MEHFNIGDKVIVVKNTERIPEEARLGEHGKIVVLNQTIVLLNLMVNY